jgi:hypothetical protein
MKISSKIKLVVALALGVMALTGCEMQAVTGITKASTPGFEDCIAAELKLNNDRGSWVYAVRCPNSATTTSHTIHYGKGRTVQRVVVIDGVTYTAEGSAKPKTPQ